MSATPAFTTTDRWCSEHRTERLWMRNGVTCCATCDNALEWVTCEPTHSLLPTRTRRVVEFWLIVLVCWAVPIGVAGLIIGWLSE